MLEKLQVAFKWNYCEMIACSMNANIFYCAILDKFYYNFVLSLNIIEHNPFSIMTHYYFFCHNIIFTLGNIKVNILSRSSSI